jgi:hypothetical protein
MTLVLVSELPVVVSPEGVGVKGQVRWILLLTLLKMSNREYDSLLLLPGLAGDEKPSSIPCVFCVDSLELGVVSLSGDDLLS